MENNFTMGSKSVITLEKERELKTIISFYNEANSITEETNQRDICQLLGRIAEYKQYVSHHYTIYLYSLQIVVSDCYSSFISKKSSIGFSHLHSFVSMNLPILKDLYRLNF